MNITVDKSDVAEGIVNFALPVAGAIARVGDRLDQDGIRNAFQSGMSRDVKFDPNTFIGVIRGQISDPFIRAQYAQYPLIQAIAWNEVFSTTKEWIKSMGRSA